MSADRRDGAAGRGDALSYCPSFGIFPEDVSVPHGLGVSVWLWPLRRPQVLGDLGEQDRCF